MFRFLCSILRKSPKFWQPNISSPVVLMYAVLCVCRAHLSSSVFAWLFPPLAPKPSGFSSHFRASIILLHLLFTYLPSPIEVAPWVESLGLILFLVLSQDLTSRTVSQAWHLLFWTKEPCCGGCPAHCRRPGVPSLPTRCQEHISCHLWQSKLSPLGGAGEAILALIEDTWVAKANWRREFI